MKMKIGLALVALVVVGFAGTASAQTWRAGSTGATGGVALGEPAIVANTNPEMNFHIPNTSTTNSDDFIVPRSYQVVVTVNAYAEGTGANGLALTLERYNEETDASSANNHFTVEDATLTGAGLYTSVWDVPAGKYYIDVTDGPDTGTAVVTVSIQRDMR